MFFKNKLTLYILSFLTLLTLNQYGVFFLKSSNQTLLFWLYLPGIDNSMLLFATVLLNLGCCSWVILKSVSKAYRNWAFCLLWASSAFFIMFSTSFLTSLPLQNS